MKTVKALLLSLALILFVLNIAVAQNWQTVYQTDFSNEPGWITNCPSCFYWDSSDSTFYANQINVPYGGNYAYYDAGYDAGSFLLEWGIIITHSEYASGLTFGLFDPDLNANNSESYAHLTFVQNDQGHVTSLEWHDIDDLGGIVEESSQWSLNEWYHVAMQYNSNDNTMTVDVCLRETGQPFFSLYATDVGPFDIDMGLLGNSNIREGSYQVPWAQFIGKFDNVSFALDLDNGGPYTANLDIKPGSCPNPINVNGKDSYKSVLPVAILGSNNFDVADIDPTTVMLEHIPALRWNVEDITTPVNSDADTCECNTLGVDGFADLTLEFNRGDIIDALGAVQDGDIIPLLITGELTDGTSFEGTDCVLIRARGNARAVVENESSIPTGVSIGNYPNPFNPSTEIVFSLLRASEVLLDVYNVMGQRVRTLVNTRLEAGQHTVTWNGTNANGQPVSSGIYLYRIEAGEFVETKKMLLLK